MDDGADLTDFRILIVEDEFLLAMDLETLLQQRGCMVLGPVPSVGQALRMLDDEQPDIALLDVNLKGERATPIAAELQARGVPYVLITGYSAVQLNEPVLRAAPRIDKPVSCCVLQRAIARAVDDGNSVPGSRIAALRRRSLTKQQQLNAARRLSVDCFGWRFWLKRSASAIHGLFRPGAVRSAMSDQPREDSGSTLAALVFAGMVAALALAGAVLLMVG